MALMPKLSRKSKFLILLLDWLLYLVALLVMSHFRLGSIESIEWISVGPGLMLLSIFIFNYIFSNYDVDSHRGRQILLNSFYAVSSHLFLFISIVYMFGIDRSDLYGRGMLFGAAFGYFLSAAWARLLIRRLFKKNVDRVNWIILCDSQIEKLIQQDQMHSQLRGQFRQINVLENQNPLSLSDLSNSVLVVAAPAASMSSQWKSYLLDKKMKGEAVMTWADFVEKSLRKIPVSHIESDWLVFTSGYSILQEGWLIRAKRMSDLFLAVFVLLLSWPFVLLTALAVKLESRGPALYSQKRTGFRGRHFTIYKFRSMRIDAEAQGPQWAAQKDPRVTRVGAFIRKTRLDELPQLYNVIIGDMSFIGPRPERPEFNLDLEKQIPFYNLRNAVRPGLTGWAQIMYPYGASVEDAQRKLEYDLYYIKNYSIILDILILLKTVKIVLFGKGR